MFGFGQDVCPPGQVGAPPFCIPDPAGPAGQAPPPAEQCPEGTYGIPPHCYALPQQIPGLPGQPPVPQPGKIPPPGPHPGGAAPAPRPLPPPPTETPGWFAQRTTGEKIAIAGAGLLAAYLIYRLATGKTFIPNRPRRRKRRKKARKNRRHRATPNLRPRARRKVAQKAARRKVRGKRARAPKGQIITLPSGKRYGHTVPPKDYYDKGARAPSDYAGGKLYTYPVIFRTRTGKLKRLKSERHIAVAKGRFKRAKRRYPMHIRRRIAAGINRAARRMGMTADVKA